MKADRGLTIERMVELGGVSRASFYRYDEDAAPRPDRDMDLRDVPGFEPQTPIRWGNSAPGKAELPGGERTPRRNGPQKHARRPHGDAPRHAHAGPKKHGGQRRDGGRSGGARQGQSRPAR